MYFFGKLGAVARRCSVEKVFLEISQNLQENTCARVCNIIKQEILAQVFSCEFCGISKNTFSYRTPPVAASERSSFIVSPKCKTLFSGIRNSISPDNTRNIIFQCNFWEDHLLQTNRF